MKPHIGIDFGTIKAMVAEYYSVRAQAIAHKLGMADLIAEYDL